MDSKRVFLGLEVQTPKIVLPEGRLLDSKDWHVTLLFFGTAKVQALLSTFKDLPFLKEPLPSGYFDSVLFLPDKKPNVACYHMIFFNDEIASFQRKLVEFYKAEGFVQNTYESWKPHMTLARQPFNEREWKNAFHRYPFCLGDLVLYESLGHSKYQPMWRQQKTRVFEEISHTADIAYEIRGKSFLDLYQNAFTALSFRYPPMTGKLTQEESFSSIDAVIDQLNDDFATIDAEIGIPYKAISYQGEFIDEEMKRWRVVIDV